MNPGDGERTIAHDSTANGHADFDGGWGLLFDFDHGFAEPVRLGTFADPFLTISNATFTGTIDYPGLFTTPLTGTITDPNERYGQGNRPRFGMYDDGEGNYMLEFSGDGTQPANMLITTNVGSNPDTWEGRFLAGSMGIQQPGFGCIESGGERHSGILKVAKSRFIGHDTPDGWTIDPFSEPLPEGIAPGFCETAFQPSVSLDLNDPALHTQFDYTLTGLVSFQPLYITNPDDYDGGNQREVYPGSGAPGLSAANPKTQLVFGETTPGGPQGKAGVLEIAPRLPALVSPPVPDSVQTFLGGNLCWDVSPIGPSHALPAQKGNSDTDLTWVPPSGRSGPVVGPPCEQNTPKFVRGRGLSANARFTNLPASNDDFGAKDFALSLNDLDSGRLVQVESVRFEVFFSRRGTDHPDAHDIALVGPSNGCANRAAWPAAYRASGRKSLTQNSRTPNWLYYWSQVVPMEPPGAVLVSSATAHSFWTDKEDVRTERGPNGYPVSSLVWADTLRGAYWWCWTGHEDSVAYRPSLGIPAKEDYDGFMGISNLARTAVHERTHVYQSGCNNTCGLRTSSDAQSLAYKRGRYRNIRGPAGGWSSALKGLRETATAPGWNHFFDRDRNGAFDTRRGDVDLDSDDDGMCDQFSNGNQRHLHCGNGNARCSFLGSRLCDTDARRNDDEAIAEGVAVRLLPKDAKGKYFERDWASPGQQHADNVSKYGANGPKADEDRD